MSRTDMYFNPDTGKAHQTLFLSTAIRNLRMGRRGVLLGEYRFDPPKKINCTKIPGEKKCESSRCFYVEADQKKNGDKKGDLRIYQINPLTDSFVKGLVEPSDKKNHNAVSRIATNRLYEPRLIKEISKYIEVYRYLVAWIKEGMKPVSVLVHFDKRVENIALESSSHLLFKNEDGYFMLGFYRGSYRLCKLVDSFRVKVDPKRVYDREGDFVDNYLDPDQLTVWDFFVNSEEIPNAVKYLHFSKDDFNDASSVFLNQNVNDTLNTCMAVGAGNLRKFPF